MWLFTFLRDVCRHCVKHGEWLSYQQIADRPSYVRICVNMYKNKWLLLKRRYFNCFQYYFLHYNQYRRPRFKYMPFVD